MINLARAGHTAIITGLLTLVLVSPLQAQDRTVIYGVADVGVSKAIPTWGLDTAWLSDVNVRRGVIFMGQPQVDVIRFSFTGNSPTTNGFLTASGLTEFNQRMTIVNSYSDSHTKLYLNNDTDYPPDASYGSPVNANNWAKLIDVTRSNCVAAGRVVLSVAPFNEPDYGTWQGDVTRFGQVCSALRTTYGAGFTGIDLCGGNVLNNDVASTWYNTLNGSGYLEQGNTHQLAGSFNNYAAFYQSVQANGDAGVNDELHNVMEAMVGVEYGMQAGVWWGSAERARGEFVKTSDGQRLGYAEHRPNWSAASVYRGTNGVVQAFIGESERQAQPTSFRYFSKDRDVFYDGDGPRRNYTVTTTGSSTYWSVTHKNAEKVINITWGEDVQPAINGRYIIVARHSLKAMEVAGSNTANGANIQQNTYTNGLNQQWDVSPLPSASGGDYSYYSITAAHSGKAPDVWNFSFSNGDSGGDIRQYQLPGTYPGVNQQWFLEYVSNGWFNIRSRWSGKYLDVSGPSTADGANIHQWSGTGGFNQQWRFIPVGESPTDTNAPAMITGVNAMASPRSVQLTWDASSDPNLRGYSVLRSTNSGGPYEIVARGSTANSFTDKFANESKTYYYVVRAVDKSWNSSVNSTQVSATPTGAPTLIARYPFADNANDASTNANHMIVLSRGPISGWGSLDLNGIGAHTMLPANMLASVSSYTVATWVYWNGGSANQRIFDFGNNTNQNMYLTPSSGVGRLRFAVTTNSGPGEQGIETTASLPTSQWVHIAVTYDGATAKMYTNGVQAASGGISLSPALFNPALNYLGKSQYDAHPHFSGQLDDVVIYNYALNQPEVAALIKLAAPTPFAASASNQVFLKWSAAGATNYIVKRAVASGGPYTTLSTQTNPTYTDSAVTNGSNYFYIVTANGLGQSADSAELSVVPGVLKLAGTVIGSPGSWNDLNSTVNTITNAFDGNTNSIYDAYYASDDWAGLDLGTAQVITQIKYCPRSTFASRMVGGVFQASNAADFTGDDVATLFTVTATPTQGILTSQIIANPGSYRYVRYVGPSGGYCNVAEVEFYKASLVPPASPTSLVATPGNAQVGLSWSAVSGATSYNVKRSVTNGGPYMTITNAAATSVTDLGLINGITYHYVVSALGTSGEGGNSTQASAMPISTTPVDLSMSLSTSNLNLWWPPDHTGWRLQTQTNGLSATNWHDVLNANQTNMLSFPVGTEDASVFFRLIHP